MPIRFAVFVASVLASLTLVSGAAAEATHHWHGGDFDNSSAPQYQHPYPDWHQPDTTTGAPQNWNPSQGDPQETPQVWDNTPPVTNDSQPQSDPWSAIPALPVSSRPTVSGRTAMIRRNGLAAIPKGAPATVRAIISAANTIIGKPYKWGGGHGRLFDSGYDCSGSVSYALIRAGLLGYPMVSGTLAHWGGKGAGRYVTIYANKSHVYMEVAGLRLDTSSVGDRGGKSGVRWRPPIGKRFGFAVRHVSGL